MYLRSTTRDFKRHTNFTTYYLNLFLFSTRKCSGSGRHECKIKTTNGRRYPLCGLKTLILRVKGIDLLTSSLLCVDTHRRSVSRTVIDHELFSNKENIIIIIRVSEDRKRRECVLQEFRWVLYWIQYNSETGLTTSCKKTRHTLYVNKDSSDPFRSGPI